MTTRTIAWGGTFPETLHPRRASDSARQSQRGPSLSADGYRCVVASSSRLASENLQLWDGLYAIRIPQRHCLSAVRQAPQKCKTYTGPQPMHCTVRYRAMSY